MKLRYFRGGPTGFPVTAGQRWTERTLAGLRPRFADGPLPRPAPGKRPSSLAQGLYWLHRSKERLGGGVDVARDPVCGMQVDVGNPGAVLREGGHTTYFCSEHCRDRFDGRARAQAASASADP